MQRVQRVWMPRNMVSGHRIGLIGLQNLSEMCNHSLMLQFIIKLTFMLNFHIQIHYVDANASSGSATRSVRDPEFMAPM